jgi:Tat protein translocase TatB subunit
MFEIGFWELALIFALGLVVLGPEKLPKVAAQLGRYAGQARRMARTLSAQVRDELEAAERGATARGAPPATSEPGYSRPGAQDLIPTAGLEGSVQSQSASAATATDSSAESSHRPQP